MVAYIHKYGGGGSRKKAWAGIQVALFTKHARFGVKQLRWVKKEKNE